ncbi:MAG TPA: histidinol-phosphatase [Bacteroidales bacterium]|jgi:histidinol-phosphatase (PHP family)|nr:histidinol-phosphatase [Bacteroidales bacterium]HPI31396.1 histidinol-phosphatase [Bacteroidales bacterium]HQP16082.1 histidinol-phosphatase [Bacteroidales bacterium]
MITTNYHTHTHFCDGSTEPEKYVLEAISKGFSALGFSAHAPLPFETAWTLSQKNVGAYCTEINNLREKYKDSIEMYLSMEIDYLPGFSGKFKQFKEKYQLDYTLGAVHLVKGADDNGMWFIDGPESNFDTGLKNFFDNDIRTAVAMYYDHLNEMIINEKPDIIAHFDKIKMNNRNRYFREDEAWYQHLLDKTIEIIAQHQCIVEVNTRGIYTGKCNAWYPGKEVLKKCCEMKIPVTVSADAHKPSDLNSYFEETEKMLKDVGYRSVRVLLNHRWTEQEI